MTVFHQFLKKHDFSFFFTNIFPCTNHFIFMRKKAYSSVFKYSRRQCSSAVLRCIYLMCTWACFKWCFIKKAVPGKVFLRSTPEEETCEKEQQRLGRRLAQWKSVPLSIERLGIRSTATEWITIATLGQDRSPQPPQQEANFRFRPVANCRNQNRLKQKKHSKHALSLQWWH